MVRTVLARREVDPNKIDKLRDWFDEMDARRDDVHEGLEVEGNLTESAFIREGENGEAPELFYYMEIDESIDFEEIDLEEIDDSVIQLGEKHEEVLEDVCVEEPDFEEFETVFHAAASDRPQI